MRRLSIGLAALLMSTSVYAQQGGAERQPGMAGRAGQGGSQSNMKTGAERDRTGGGARGDMQGDTTGGGSMGGAQGGGGGRTGSGQPGTGRNGAM